MIIKMMKSYWLFYIVFVSSFLFSQDRRPSFPLITGDGFRHISNHLYDETSKNINPDYIKNGDVIFVKSDYIREFYELIHPKIRSSYILISHNSDISGPTLCEELLEEDKVIAWLAQNADSFTHRKLIPIPIGLENRYNGYGDPVQILSAMTSLKKKTKDFFLYLNFSLGTSLAERTLVYDLFKDQAVCFLNRKLYPDYLDDLSRAFFVLCPRGNGYDCHRTWEALYMGAYPIVKSSGMDALFDNLPVVIVKDWHEITTDFLVKQQEILSNRSFNSNKLYMPYWIKLIRSLKNNVCENS